MKKGNNVSEWKREEWWVVSWKTLKNVKKKTFCVNIFTRYSGIFQAIKYKSIRSRKKRFDTNVVSELTEIEEDEELNEKEEEFNKKKAKSFMKFEPDISLSNDSQIILA